MIVFLFCRNNIPAKQQLFCKSRSFELLPFCRPDPGAGSESQAAGEHLLHKVILQTYSWYGFIKILLISHNSWLSSKPLFFTFVCVKNEKALEINVLVVFHVHQSYSNSLHHSCEIHVLCCIVLFLRNKKNCSLVNFN